MLSSGLGRLVSEVAVNLEFDGRRDQQPQAPPSSTIVSLQTQSHIATLQSVKMTQMYNIAGRQIGSHVVCRRSVLQLVLGDLVPLKLHWSCWECELHANSAL